MANIGLEEENLSNDVRLRLVDCQKISQEALSLIKSCIDCRQFSLYVCLDDKKIAQSIACAWFPDRINKMYLSKIVTCPWNILAVNQIQKDRSVKGAGTALIARLLSEARKYEKDLTLNSLPSAKDFYLKIGFKQDNNEEENMDSIQMTFHYLS